MTLHIVGRVVLEPAVSVGTPAVQASFIVWDPNEVRRINQTQEHVSKILDDHRRETLAILAAFDQEQGI